ncbi:MAG: TetR/AcrR family transcriptional regulator [Flavobacteriaceae bacterium]|nr:TetR/AcrR family transcriptional regulator [Flavobacteriaceae bacterium]MDH3795628.1 TetR/AcrR family transcriptional regulator [Flavobacteriaceae bacterium]
MEQTLKRLATMQRLQVAGLELFYQNGYHNTSVDDILKKLDLSKGAFYYHFKSKEEFFISIIQNLIVQRVYSALVQPIEGKEDPFTIIEESLDASLETAEHNFFDNGFVLSNFLSETQGKDPEINTYLNDILKIWEVALITSLQKGKSDGYVARHVDSDGVAAYIISAYMGIRLQMACGNAKNLRYKFIQQLRIYFRSLAPQPIH